MRNFGILAVLCSSAVCAQQSAAAQTGPSEPDAPIAVEIEVSPIATSTQAKSFSAGGEKLNQQHTSTVPRSVSVAHVLPDGSIEMECTQEGHEHALLQQPEQK
jgi:hypothetical protein